VELIRNTIKVELEDIGEGWSGDYDPEDPEDEALLRFSVLRRQGSDWESLDDASYCTRLRADLPEADQRKALEILMDQVYEPAKDGNSIKKLCERLSWIGPDWLHDSP